MTGAAAPRARIPTFSAVFVLLLVGGFLFTLSLQLLIPVLAVYASSLGGSGWEVGLVIGGFSLASLLFRLPMGRGADRLGRWPLMMLGAAIFSAVPMLFIVADRVAVLVLLRFVQGIGLCAYTTAALAMVADIAPPSRRGEVMGLYGVGVMGAIAAGPAISGVVASVLGYGPTFLLSTASALGALLAAAAIRGASRRVVTEHVNLRRALREVASDDNVRTAALGIATQAVSWGILIAFFPLYIASLGFGPGMVGAFFTVMAITTIASRPLGGWLSDRVDRGLLGLAGLLADTVAVLALPFTSEPVGFAACGVVYGLGFGTCGACFTALSVDTVSPPNRGMAVSAYYIGTDMGVTVGSALLGGLTVVLGVGELFYVTAAAMAASVLLLAYHRVRVLASRKKPFIS